MSFRIASARGRTSIRMPALAGRAARSCTVALAATLALAAPAPVLAQAPAQPAPKAQPKAQPKAAPQAAPAATPGAPEVPPISFSPWTKVCLKDQEANAQQVCFTGKEGRIETGMLVIGAVVIEPEGSPSKLLRITLPLGMSLAQGTRVIVDQGQPMTSPYLMCLPTGCVADYEVSAELLGKLHKGQSMAIQGVNSQGQVINIPVPLPDFAKANDGPPTDPKVVEERQKKLQEEYDKKNAQQQQQAPK